MSRQCHAMSRYVPVIEEEKREENKGLRAAMPVDNPQSNPIDAAIAELQASGFSVIPSGQCFRISLEDRHEVYVMRDSLRWAQNLGITTAYVLEFMLAFQPAVSA